MVLNDKVETAYLAEGRWPGYYNSKRRVAGGGLSAQWIALKSGADFPRYHADENKKPGSKPGFRKQKRAEVPAV
jgi:hypothetical protein